MKYRIGEPSAIVFEHDGFRAADAIASGKSYNARAVVQIDMHLKLNHCEAIALAA